MACSDCIFTTCHKPSCTFKQAGGNEKNFYITNKCWLASPAFTYDDDPDCCVIKEFLFDDPVTQGWIPVTAIKDTIVATETVTLPNKFILQNLVFQITNVNDNPNAAQGYCIASQFAQQLINSDEGFLVLIENKLGVWVVYGLTTGMEVSAGVKTTGTVLADVASNTITFEAGEPEYAKPVKKSYVKGLAPYAGLVICTDPDCPTNPTE